ncbi:ABC transporter permease [Butyrivibrio sp. MC2013]|uniref:ABC transporter permease n=1 Tax=Butyrivibrio sp. MC2013 TaxID=1280686 RepID=UPI0004208E0C|nr:ABC transporter permease [Butyrivibrio sp. MC2013]
MLARYIRIEYKRVLIQLCRMSLALIMSLAVTFGMSYAITGIMEHLTEQGRIEVAMVLPGGDEGKSLKAFSRLIASQKSVSEICDIVYMEEDRAVAAIESGDIAAAIIFGQGFIHDVMTGINTPARVILPSHTDLLTDTFREELTNGVSLIRTGEAAIYSVTEAGLYSYPLIVDRADMEETLTDLLMSLALKRVNYLGTEGVSVYGGLSPSGYFVAGFMAFFLFLSGISFAGLYSAQDLALRRSLSLRGPGAVAGSIIRTMVMASVLVLEGLVTGLLISRTHIVYSGSEFTMSFGMLPALIAASFSMAGVFHFIYSLSLNERNNIMVTVLADILMMLLSGLIFPVAFLPAHFELLSRISFMTAWRSCLILGLMGEAGGTAVVVSLMIGAAGLIGGALMQMRRMNS